MRSSACQRSKQTRIESPNEDNNNKLHKSSTACDKIIAKGVAAANTIDAAEAELAKGLNGNEELVCENDVSPKCIPNAKCMLRFMQSHIS